MRYFRPCFYGDKGCKPSEDGGQWTLPLQGRRLKLEDLIRFPSDFVKYESAFKERLESEHPCGSKDGAPKRLLFDYESFQVDRQGHLAFTRVLGRQKVSEFCIDLVSVPGEKGDTKKHHFMTAVFCQPDNVTHVDQDLLKLRLANAGTRMTSTTGLAASFVFTLLTARTLQLPTMSLGVCLQ